MQKWHEGKQNAMQHAIRLPDIREEILGIFLRDGTLFREYRNQLQPEMFGEYAWIYQVMRQTDEVEIVTFLAVSSRCRERLEVLHALRNSVASVHVLADRVKELRKRTLSEKILEYSNTWSFRSVEDDPDEILRDMQEKSYLLTSTEFSGIADPDKDVDDWHQYMLDISHDPSKAFGLLTSIEELDRITTGYHRGDLIVIGARTSMGKSAFMIDTVLRLAKNGYKCAIFSLEMSKRQIYNRMMANLMNVYLETLRLGRIAKERLKEIEQYKTFLKQVYVDDTRGVTADYIVDSMRTLKRTKGLDFVAVDYIQDIQEPGESNDNSGSSIGRICRKIRAGAQTSDCSVMALSQVSRDVEKRIDKRPKASDLSGSTGIETAADVIGLLYRDEYYNPDTEHKNIMEVNFEKQRNGQLGKVELFYDRNTQRLFPIEKSAGHGTGRVRY